MYSKSQIDAAIDAEAADWAKFFDVIGRPTEAEDIEGRKAVMRANIAVGYLDPLMPFLEAKAYQEYLDAQSNPSLSAMERAGDRGPSPHDAEAYDEMVRHDNEGRS